MDSPYLIFGLLVLITGFFLAIAMSLQLCACVRTFRRIQREKIRLREIREAAAQPPPPYALVVSSCHLNHRGTDLQQQFQPFPQPPHTGNNVCCVIGTLCQHRQSPNLSASQSTHDTLTLTNSGPINTFYYSSYPQSSNEIHVSSECINCNKQCSSLPEVHERLPTYEEAIKIEDESDMAGVGEAKY